MVDMVDLMTAADRHSDARGVDDAVRAAQIDLLYRAPAFLLLNIAVAVIAAAVLWPVYPPWAVVLWLAILCLTVWLRLLSRRQYLGQSGRERGAAYWGRRFVLGTTVTGCLWGATASALLLTPATQYHAFVFLMLAGLAAAATVAHAAYIPAFLGFVIPAFGPFLAVAASRPHIISTVLALLLAAFVALLLAVGRTINQWMASNARLQVAQTAMADDLKTASAELHRRDAMLRAVVGSAAELLRTFDLEHSLATVLKLIGESTGVSRVYLYQRSTGADGGLRVTKYGEWLESRAAPDAVSALPSTVDLEAEGLSDWVHNLVRDGIGTAVVRQPDGLPRELLEKHGTKSNLIVPVMVQGSWWGQLGVDDCVTERHWSAADIATLKTIAELVGAAIGHARDLEEFTTTARIVEHSSTVLYRLQPRPPYELTYLSRNASRYGYRMEQLLAQPTRYTDLIHPEDRPKVMDDLARIAEGQQGEVSAEYRLRQADGTYVWFDAHFRSIHDEGGRLTAIEGLLVDINERKTAAADIARLAQTDQLTGLPSRKNFMEHLAHAFIASTRGAPPFAILYLDLDRFKDVNDARGHSKGDELLKAVAARLTALCRANDVVARLGGDEFAVIQLDVAEPSAAGTLAARILQALSAPYNLGTAIHITASLGIAVYDADVSGPEELMQRADLALYRAKEAGRNQYHFHSDVLDTETRERVTLGEELHLALHRHEFEIYYQPQVEVPSGIIRGIEALVRWNHPTRGLILPSRFIPVAEKAGTIVPLGLWIVDEVCRQIALWRREIPELPVVAINLSAAQLRPALAFDRELAAILRRHGLDATAIEFELTESVLMQTTGENSETVENLRALGASIAIDDFGTGYSSLEYLRAYRVNHIKIAQQFVRDLTTDPGDAAIVRATIGLARELGIEVVAEGVETPEQLDAIAQAGCRIIQGHYFSRAVAASEVTPMLLKGRIERSREGATKAGERGA